ncbi:unnamed protein product, partial [Rotaria sordida]
MVQYPGELSLLHSRLYRSDDSRIHK